MVKVIIIVPSLRSSVRMKSCDTLGKCVAAIQFLVNQKIVGAFAQTAAILRTKQKNRPKAVSVSSILD
jgi:hypothetical protein